MSSTVPRNYIILTTWKELPVGKFYFLDGEKFYKYSEGNSVNMEGKLVCHKTDAIVEPLGRIS